MSRPEFASVFFHEDDCGLIELLPRANAARCQQQLTQKDDFAAAHEAPGGIGWTDMYVVPPPDVPLSTLEIDVAALDACVPETIPGCSNVTTGYSSHREPCVRTRAFCFSPALKSDMLFVHWNESGIVESAWFSGLPDEVDRGPLLEALRNIAKRWDLILVSWTRSYVVGLDELDRLSGLE